MKYRYYVQSPSNRELGLGYNDLKQAQIHCDEMNQLVEEYEINKLWNKEVWKEKPLPFEIVDNEI